MSDHITLNDPVTLKYLKNFLRENLSISIDHDYGFYSDNTYEVKLELCGEEISRSSVEVRCANH